MTPIECMLHYTASRREGWDHWESVRFLLNEFCRLRKEEQEEKEFNRQLKADMAAERRNHPVFGW